MDILRGVEDRFAGRIAKARDKFARFIGTAHGQTEVVKG
jgi:hypothetical protein